MALHGDGGASRDDGKRADARGKHAASGNGEARHAHVTGYGEAAAYELARQGRRKRIWMTVFALALLVFVASIAALGVMGYSYLEGQHKYDEVADIAHTGDISSVSEIVLAEGESGQAGGVDVDWVALAAVNPDTRAWLYIPGTKVNYPVVQGRDNEHYLNYDFGGNAGWLAHYGSIFMDYRNRPGWVDPCYFIFGHHMNDGSMFSTLVDLTDQQKFNECRTIYVLSPQGNLKLRTFAVIHIPPEEAVVMTRFASKAEMSGYIADKISRSLVTASDVVAPSDMSMIFGFATCDNESWGRFVVFAYVEATSIDDLNAEIGVDTEDGRPVGLKDEIEVEGGAQASEDSATRPCAPAEKP